MATVLKGLMNRFRRMNYPFPLPLSNPIYWTPFLVQGRNSFLKNVLEQECMEAALQEILLACPFLEQHVRLALFRAIGRHILALFKKLEGSAQIIWILECFCNGGSNDWLLLNHPRRRDGPQFLSIVGFVHAWYFSAFQECSCCNLQPGSVQIGQAHRFDFQVGGQEEPTGQPSKCNPRSWVLLGQVDAHCSSHEIGEVPHGLTLCRDIPEIVFQCQ
mmetsp:Transcript_10205/g.62256  ORF Transcript_10205/g.62256 Transcript_10205/m.62256 type:complete len:217 (+) Transcript_10205:2354-3004(+)